MLNNYCQEKIVVIEEKLREFLTGEDKYPPLLFEAMNYSVFAGGKRLRPILLLAAAETVGGKWENYLPAACALEMIHTYSLIHDDLPAMDNDDFRRGKPTNHKIYGDGVAILAGDGLLTAAFEMLLMQTVKEPTVLQLVMREIAVAAGPQGMVGGQVVDLIATGKELDAATLRRMHAAKTGALFRAAVRAGALLADADQRQLEALTFYAEQFGLAFQITDDILDVTGSQAKIGKPVGSDERNGKVTYVSLYSLAGARELANSAVKQALAGLTSFGEQAAVLREILLQLTKRDA